MISDYLNIDNSIKSVIYFRKYYYFFIFILFYKNIKLL